MSMFSFMFQPARPVTGEWGLIGDFTWIVRWVDNSFRHIGCVSQPILCFYDVLTMLMKMKLIYICFIHLSLWFQVMKCMTMIYAMNVMFCFYETGHLYYGVEVAFGIPMTCLMKFQLPGMPVATCSDPTRDLLWWWPSPHPYGATRTPMFYGATSTTHDYGPLSRNICFKYENMF